MELYKVYARCCKTNNHIRKVELFKVTDELHTAFDIVFNEGEESGLIDVSIYDEDGDFVCDDAIKINNEYTKIRDYFEVNGYIDCGDYSLFDITKCDISIPNMGSNSASIIFM